MSKTERLLEAIGEIDEKYVAESDKFTKNSNKAWLGITAAAACALVVAGVGVRFLNSGGINLPYGETTKTVDSEQSGATVSTTAAVTPEVTTATATQTTAKTTSQTIVTDPNLPVLTYPDKLSNGGMGFEGYIVYDISELISGNPWTESDEIDTLPVYKNNRFFDDEGYVPNTDFEQMKSILLEKATALGYEISDDDIIVNNDIISNEDLESIRQAYLEFGTTSVIQYFAGDRVEYKSPDGSFEIKVNSWLDVTIKIPPLADIPEDMDDAEYNEYYSYSRYEEFAELFRNYINQHPNLLGFENPEVVIFGGDRNIYGDQSFDIGIYERAGDLENQIVNYNLANCRIGITDETWYIRINGAEKSQAVADYPIITADEAKQLLLAGNYGSSYNKFFGEEAIAKVELVYRESMMDKYYLPYYKFYAEIYEQSGLEDKNLKTYATYYVPAVNQAYLTGLPVYKSGFNGANDYDTKSD